MMFKTIDVGYLRFEIVWIQKSGFWNDVVCLICSTLEPNCVGWFKLNLVCRHILATSRDVLKNSKFFHKKKTTKLQFSQNQFEWRLIKFGLNEVSTNSNNCYCYQGERINLLTHVILIKIDLNLKRKGNYPWVILKKCNEPLLLFFFFFWN